MTRAPIALVGERMFPDLREEEAADSRAQQVRFGRTQVFRDVTCSVRRGAALAIIGPNGSRKTVLFKALIGALPYEGTIRWAVDAKIGYVPKKLDIQRDLPLAEVGLLRSEAAVTRVEPAVVAQTMELASLDPENRRQADR